MTCKNRIVYYDFNDLNYSSYFLAGFFENRKEFSYAFTITKKIPRMLFDKQFGGPWKSLLFSVCLFKAQFRNDEFYFCIDTRDSCDASLDSDCGYHLPLLEKVKYYFKVNYNQNKICMNRSISNYSEKIIPALPFFPVKVPSRKKLFPRIFPCRTVAWTISDSIHRIKMLKQLLTLRQIAQMRNVEKDSDVFFVVKLYNQDIHSRDNAMRLAIMKEIQKLRHIKSRVGFVMQSETVPEDYLRFLVPKYSFSRYLNCMARSRVAIYVKGLHNCISFKFGELLALGMPIVGNNIKNNSDKIMNHRYFSEQFAYEDPEAIVRQVVELLGNQERRISLGLSNSTTFDREFTPRAVVSDILRHIV